MVTPICSFQFWRLDDIIEHSPIKTNKDGSIDYLTPILIVKAVKKTNN